MLSEGGGTDMFFPPSLGQAKSSTEEGPQVVIVVRAYALCDWELRTAKSN